MNIPFFNKQNPNDSNCAPVCLQMALAYYGINKSIDEIYRACGSIGDSHYTLPWGICIGAAAFGLKAYFISEQPYELNEDSRLDIMNITGLGYEEIVSMEKNQLDKCDASDLVNILLWDAGFRDLPERILTQRAGVVIPTLWWGSQPHNVVLTKYMVKEDAQIYYHDPNSPNGSENIMPYHIFLDKWIHVNTDNDIIIITSGKEGQDVKIAAKAREKNNAMERQKAAAFAAAMAALAKFNETPLVSTSKKIIWQNVFNNYPIPSGKTELTIKIAKEWSESILKSLKEKFPHIPLHSSPDPEDNKILGNLIMKYKADPYQTWLELDLLQKINNNLYKSNDNEIFFLLYRLIEK